VNMGCEDLKDGLFASYKGKCVFNDGPDKPFSAKSKKRWNPGWGHFIVSLEELKPFEACELKFTIVLTIYGDYEFCDSAQPQQFKINLGKSIRENVDADFVIVLKDESEIPTHRTLLAATSPVFKSMLSHDMGENLDGRITIDDFEPDIVRKFIDSLYNDELPEPHPAQECHYKQIFAIADKYQVESIARTCLSHMVSELGVSNACFVFGSMKRCGYFQGTDLERRVSRFINDNFEDLDGTDDFKAIAKDPAMLLSIFRQRGTKRKRGEENEETEKSQKAKRRLGSEAKGWRNSPRVAAEKAKETESAKHKQQAEESCEEALKKAKEAKSSKRKTQAKEIFEEEKSSES